MEILRQIKDSLLHLAFPHVCEACGSDILNSHHFICARCLAELPQTNFHLHPNNPIEKMFWGRIPFKHASSQFYFTKESNMQHLMHSFKYRGNKDLGFYLGQLMGELLSESNRFRYVDALVPLPLFASKERKRGYNQATVLCEGIASVLNKPVLAKVITRTNYTESQTRKSRIERWMNMEGRFRLKDPDLVRDKHILLVDDVVTTGATLEACANELLKTENILLSLATLCFSSH